MLSSSSTKMVSMATRDLYSITSKTPSLTHFRPLTCAAAAATSSSPPCPSLRVPHLPLTRPNQVGEEFVHQAVKIAQVDPYGLGLVSSEEIPNGSDLIALPHHVPLKFGSLESDSGDGAYSVLVNLARQVPALNSSMMVHFWTLQAWPLGFHPPTSLHQLHGSSRFCPG
ncbi:Histone-lysine N-methyltransferase [Actinidia chinensis var. chinensis]|uniref:Histone-lysine N-methyltransferase n=1 Tax=Actinidia chinensis var. chinensis TaxID=1590841 RepID=A0A2R6PGP7_ACTCC|nr:Histone-lysine N-methyltransferase [Actinidia chinensis var. chinensis]